MATKTSKSLLARRRRQRSIRKKIKGTPEMPRLCVFRSVKHIYAQVIDDVNGVTLAQASTQSAELKGELEGKKKSEQAKLVGAAAAKQCVEKDIKKVCFDRNGFIYHGRIKALADGARSAGLEF